MEQAIDSIAVERWTRSANDRGYSWSVFDDGTCVGIIWFTGIGRWFAQTNAQDLARYGKVEQFNEPRPAIDYLVQRATNFDPMALSVTP